MFQSCENRARWAAMLVAACLFAGCGPSEPARQRLRDADADYRRGNYAAATDKAGAFLKEYPNVPESAEAHYLRGICALKTRQTAAADADLRACLRLSRRPDLTALAHEALGNLEYEAGRLKEASEHFALALSETSGKARADEIHYRYGVCLQRDGRWEDARQQFSAVLHFHPDSPLAADARRRFSWPTDAGFAIQCGIFGTAGAAETYAANLRKAGLAARRVAEVRAGKPSHVVYVGKYATLREAEAALPAVRKQVSDAVIAP